MCPPSSSRESCACRAVQGKLAPSGALAGEGVLCAGPQPKGTPARVAGGGETGEVAGAQAGAGRAGVPGNPAPDGCRGAVTLAVGTESGRPLTLLLGRLPLV